MEGLDYLAEMQEVTDEMYQGSLVIVTDTANSPRISDQRYNLGDLLIKIDHHPNDEPYGDLVWVNTHASSCSEMIADLAFSFPDLLKMSNEAARLIYAVSWETRGAFVPGDHRLYLEVAGKLLTYDFDVLC